MSHFGLVDRYTCKVCTIYNSDTAAEDKNDHTARAYKHEIFFCPACRATSCTVETLSAHFDDEDSAEGCQKFSGYSLNDILHSRTMSKLKPTNSPAPGMMRHRNTVSSAQYLEMARAGLLERHPERESSISKPYKQ